GAEPKPVSCPKCSRRRALVLCLWAQRPQLGILVITNFFSPAALCLVAEPHAPRTHGRCESVHDSLPKGSRKVDSLAYPLPHFLEPRSWIRAMNHAPQKAQSLGGIVAVSPD